MFKTKRKQFIFKAISVLFILNVIASVSACSNALSFKSDENGNLIDEKNGKYYILCSLSLRAASTRPDAYAKAEKGYKVYEIPNMSPDEWLSENAKDAIPFVYHEENVEEPDLENFEPVRIHITQTEVVTIAIGYIEDIETIEQIIDNMLNGEICDVPMAVKDTFTFNFASDKYPGLFYCIQYVYDESGKSYLYDRGSRKCVIAVNDYLYSGGEGENEVES